MIENKPNNNPENKKINRDLKEEKIKDLKKESLELKEQAQQQAEEKKQQEKKEEEKSFLNKFFSLKTAGSIVSKMTGYKAFSVFREHQKLKKGKEDFKNKTEIDIENLVESFRSKENSKESKIEKLELKNKLRKLRVENPDQYKKAVNVLFKSRNEKQNLKDKISQNIDSVYSKEIKDKKQELVKESINTALVAAGAITGGAVAYSTVIVRAINNLGFDIGKQFEDNEGKVNIKEFKSAISKAKKSFEEKSFVGKVSEVTRYGALGYMIYNGYDMSQAGTIDDYESLLGKLKDVDYESLLPKAESKEINLSRNPYKINKVEEVLPVKSSEAENLENKREVKRESINIEVQRGDSFSKILNNNKDFWKSIGADHFSQNEKNNLIANLTARIEDNEVLKDKYLNLNPGDKLDLGISELKELISGKIGNYENLVTRADALDLSTTNNENINEVHSETETTSEKINVKSEESLSEKTESKNKEVLEYNNSLKQNLQESIKKGFPNGGQYEIKAGDTTWKIVKEKLLEDTFKLNNGENALSEAQLNNLTANILKQLREEVKISPSGELKKQWGCNLSYIQQGDNINMNKFLELIENKKIKINGEKLNLLERASIYTMPEKLAGGYVDYNDCGGKPCGAKTIKVEKNPVRTERIPKKSINLESLNLNETRTDVDHLNMGFGPVEGAEEIVKVEKNIEPKEKKFDPCTIPWYAKRFPRCAGFEHTKDHNGSSSSSSSSSKSRGADLGSSKGSGGSSSKSRGADLGSGSL